ncbi:asparagine synthase-domain-containing protein [Kockovaella imperatae]|uniref:Asparagine synthase-domain-containing protein n=1 Tax=Kockovaella imperatae TaxID=4999 RepID=A0A1Y1U9U2_9TREE|nr:asparagine synthase-domain-containing protein [Kockovaella imperatae]ORX34782.1 asparagine synthase-domain-containing protein [Kockovaella imperatae]
MCGISLSLRLVPHHSSSSVQDHLSKSLEAPIKARGPDSYQTFQTRIPLDSQWDVELTLSVSVLSLRGTGTVRQPVVTHRGVLAWNGQIFQGVHVGKEDNDTAKLAELIDSTDVDDPRALLPHIEGPYAFVFFDTKTQTLFFQVDPLSRRSLLIHPIDHNAPMQTFMLSSTRVESLSRLQDDPRVSDDNESHVADFLQRLASSVRRRIENIPNPRSGDARVAVLFSGGVDCSLLAALIHRFIPADEPIDLLNVAFAQLPDAKSVDLPRFDVPDRLSGRQSLGELRAACPRRQWRFVEINVSQKECEEHRSAVMDLMYPNATEMDLSLAYPLYFASRGQGHAQAEAYEPYSTAAKVYISGLGADEQLAGYARHRGAFQRDGIGGLLDELQKDLDRLPTRNLARDDRLISSHGRESRYPYLDLSFVTYLSSLPLSIKCDLSREGGDKALLRAAAAKCGLTETSQRIKRAMQFGTRSAKMSGQDKPRAKRGQQLANE